MSCDHCRSVPVVESIRSTASVTRDHREGAEAMANASTCRGFSAAPSLNLASSSQVFSQKGAVFHHLAARAAPMLPRAPLVSVSLLSLTLLRSTLAPAI
jgi:hypothetical protein